MVLTLRLVLNHLFVFVEICQSVSLLWLWWPFSISSYLSAIILGLSGLWNTLIVFSLLVTQVAFVGKYNDLSQSSVERSKVVMISYYHFHRQSWILISPAYPNIKTIFVQVVPHFFSSDATPHRPIFVLLSTQKPKGRAIGRNKYNIVSWPLQPFATLCKICAPRAGYILPKFLPMNKKTSFFRF